jgi:hypothetical protein
MPYDLGDVAVLEFQATDVSGAPAAAASIALSLVTPDGVTHALTPTAGLPPDQTGSPAGWYFYEYTTLQIGRHTVAWTASGTPGVGSGVGADTDSWDVRSATDDMIISLADMKRRLRLTATDEFDQDIREFGLAITGVVEKLAGAIVVRTIVERQRAGGMFIALNKRPVYQPATQPYQIVAMTPVLTYGLVYDLSLLTVDMDLGMIRHSAGLPFIYGPYDMTYTVGRQPAPDNAILAASIILRHLWAIERPDGVRGGGAVPVEDDVTMMYGFAIPNRAIEILEAAGTREAGGIA